MEIFSSEACVETAEVCVKTVRLFDVGEEVCYWFENQLKVMRLTFVLWASWAKTT